MAKKKYMVDGTNLTRSTDRTYTHAVIVVDSEGKNPEGTIGFCGRLDLAQKLKAQWEPYYAVKETNWKLEIREVHEVIKNNWLKA